MNDDLVLTAAEQDRLRELLHAAADGIDVRSPAPAYLEQRTRPARTGRGPWLAAASVVAVALAGAAWWATARDDSGSVETAATATTVDGSTDTAVTTTTVSGLPGTPLGAGFTVAEGTELIGDPIPAGPTGWGDDGPVYGDEGWTATTVVDGGDPLQIIDHYLAQAAEAAMTVTSAPSCRREVELTVCGATAGTTSGPDPANVSVSFLRGRSADIVSNHVVVQYWTGSHVEATTPPAGSVAPIPPAPEVASLPDVGEPIGTANEVSSRILVQEGSRLAGPVRLNLDDATGGIVAIFEVTGDPRKVFDAYVEHVVAQRVPADDDAPAVHRVGDATVTATYPGGGGGDYFELALIERPGRPTWLVIEGAHD